MVIDLELGRCPNVGHHRENHTSPRVGDQCLDCGGQVEPVSRLVGRLVEIEIAQNNGLFRGQRGVRQLVIGDSTRLHRALREDPTVRPRFAEE